LELLVLDGAVDGASGIALASLFNPEELILRRTDPKKTTCPGRHPACSKAIHLFHRAERSLPVIRHLATGKLFCHFHGYRHRSVPVKARDPDFAGKARREVECLRLLLLRRNGLDGSPKNQI